MDLHFVYWDQLRKISYGHTDNIYVTIITDEEKLEFERFNSLEQINNYPDAKSICVAGLKQQDFDRFNIEFADRFSVIHYWKCPLVADLSSLGKLHNVRYITYFWNQRTTRLWDMSGNKLLQGVLIDAFSRMHDLSDVCTAPDLREFWIDSGYSLSHYKINSLKPLMKCNTLETLKISVDVGDSNAIPLLYIPKLRELQFSEALFTTEQIAMLTAFLPDAECPLLSHTKFLTMKVKKRMLE